MCDALKRVRSDSRRLLVRGVGCPVRDIGLSSQGSAPAREIPSTHRVKMVYRYIMNFARRLSSLARAHGTSCHKNPHVSRVYGARRPNSPEQSSLCLSNPPISRVHVWSPLVWDRRYHQSPREKTRQGMGGRDKPGSPARGRVERNCSSSPTRVRSPQGRHLSLTLLP